MLSHQEGISMQGIYLDLNKQQSIVSQKSNLEADKLNKSFVTADSKIKIEDSDYDYLKKKSKILISKDQIYNSNLESINSNKRKEIALNNSEKIQEIIVRYFY